MFPDGKLVPLSETIQIAESVGWEVCDVQNPRKPYVRTLNLWLQEFERNSSTILKTASGAIAVYQILFRRLKEQCATPMLIQESCYEGWTLRDQAKIA